MAVEVDFTPVVVAAMVAWEARAEFLDTLQDMAVEVEAFYKKGVRILEIFRMKHWLTSPLYGTLHPSSSETRRLSSPSPSISGRVFGGGRGTLMGW